MVWFARLYPRVREADPGYTPGKDIYHPLPPHTRG